MIRKFNYTNRIRIKRADIQIIESEKSYENSYDIDFSKLKKYNFPENSLVFLEAYLQTNWMRFNLGCIKTLNNKQSISLEKFDSCEGILFRVKITADSDFHKLIAEADSISLLSEGFEEIEREPLLPVKPSHEIGDEIYRVDFSDARPLLLINCEVGDYKEIGRSPAFLSLVYPSVLREILTKIILIEKYQQDDDLDSWQSRWIRFIKKYPGIGEIPNIDYQEDCEDWITNAVSIFAKKIKTRNKFIEFWRDEV